MFPFSAILKSVLKSLIYIYPNVNYYRHSVSILLIVELLSELGVRSENQSLGFVLPFFVFVVKFFFLNLQRVSSLLYG